MLIYVYGGSNRFQSVRKVPSDFSLVTSFSGDFRTRVLAHRAPLMAYSKFFATLFSGEFQDSSSEELHLRDVPAVILRHLLDYLYDGHASIEVEDIVMFCHVCDRLLFQAPLDAARKSLSALFPCLPKPILMGFFMLPSISLHMVDPNGELYTVMEKDLDILTTSPCVFETPAQNLLELLESHKLNRDALFNGSEVVPLLRAWACGCGDGSFEVSPCTSEAFHLNETSGSSAGAFSSLNDDVSFSVTAGDGPGNSLCQDEDIASDDIVLLGGKARRVEMRPSTSKTLGVWKLPSESVKESLAALKITRFRFIYPEGHGTSLEKRVHYAIAALWVLFIEDLPLVPSSRLHELLQLLDVLRMTCATTNCGDFESAIRRCDESTEVITAELRGRDLRKAKMMNGLILPIHLRSIVASPRQGGCFIPLLLGPLRVMSWFHVDRMLFLFVSPIGASPNASPTFLHVWDLDTHQAIARHEWAYAAPFKVNDRYFAVKHSPNTGRTGGLNSGHLGEELAGLAMDYRCVGATGRTPEQLASLAQLLVFECSTLQLCASLYLAESCRQCFRAPRGLGILCVCAYSVECYSALDQWQCVATAKLPGATFGDWEVVESFAVLRTSTRLDIFEISCSGHQVLSSNAAKKYCDRCGGHSSLTPRRPAFTPMESPHPFASHSFSPVGSAPTVPDHGLPGLWTSSRSSNQMFSTPQGPPTFKLRTLPQKPGPLAESSPRTPPCFQTPSTLLSGVTCQPRKLFGGAEDVNSIPAGINKDCNEDRLCKCPIPPSSSRRLGSTWLPSGGGESPVTPGATFSPTPRRDSESTSIVSFRFVESMTLTRPISTKRGTTAFVRSGPISGEPKPATLPNQLKPSDLLPRHRFIRNYTSEDSDSPDEKELPARIDRRRRARAPHREGSSDNPTENSELQLMFYSQEAVKAMVLRSEPRVDECRVVLKGAKDVQQIMSSGDDSISGTYVCGRGTISRVSYNTTKESFKHVSMRVGLPGSSMHSKLLATAGSAVAFGATNQALKTKLWAVLLSDSPSAASIDFELGQYCRVADVLPITGAGCVVCHLSSTTATSENTVVSDDIIGLAYF